MTIESVAVGEAVEAPTINQLILNVNDSPGRAVFTSNGSWSVPSGVHKFKVTLCGGGGGGGATYVVGGGEDSSFASGGTGGNGPMISALFSGVELGTTYAITIGAGGAATATGGTTSFGAVMSSAGGTPGGSPGTGSPGAATFPGGAPSVYHYNGIFQTSGVTGSGYGQGGGSDAAGVQGVVIIEW